MKVWIAADKYDEKRLYMSKPRRAQPECFWYSDTESIMIEEHCFDDDRIARLTWEDEPVEIDIHWINKITINN